MKVCKVTRLSFPSYSPPLFASAESRVVSLQASDGVNLKASYASPGREGPAMLLIHQCNMDKRVLGRGFPMIWLQVVSMSCP
ncbi:MAG: hypothetical protein CM1200mP9_09500 [Gammaproteobacteria bacterium]|nr:MAG: hypothetical protein CM1200mP9_09500 [Gammaproteobacteria bacterium]